MHSLHLGVSVKNRIEQEMTTLMNGKGGRAAAQKLDGVAGGFSRGLTRFRRGIAALSGGRSRRDHGQDDDERAEKGPPANHADDYRLAAGGSSSSASAGAA